MINKLYISQHYTAKKAGENGYQTSNILTSENFKEKNEEKNKLT